MPSAFSVRLLRRLAQRARILSLLALTAITLLAAALPARADAQQMAGAHLHILWGNSSSADMDAQLDKAKAANAGIVRVDLGWSSLEQDGKGKWSSWYLDKIDAVMAKAEARGLKVLFSVDWTPCWASSAPDSLKQNCEGAWWSRGVQFYPPKNPADYGDGLAFLVRRYGQRVAAYEVWNEPNSHSYFKASDKVGSYAAILKAAYPAAKAANPNVTVLGGSLMNADAEFVEALYAQGIKGHFDGFSIHPYNADRDPSLSIDSRYAEYTFTQGVPLVRDVMVRHGDADKKLWLTEFGWSTSPTRGAQPFDNGVDEATQALYLAKAYRQMQQWSYVAAGFWYQLADTGDGSAWLDTLGLLRADRSEKPAYAAFRTAAGAIKSGATVPVAGAPATTAAPSSTTARTGTGTTARRPAARKPVRRTPLRVVLRKRNGRLYATGTAPRSRTVVIKVTRPRQAGAAATNAGFRVRVRVGASGRFSTRLRAPRLLRGRWRAVATLLGGGSPSARASTRIA